jgi:hypothetical protein
MLPGAAQEPELLARSATRTWTGRPPSSFDDPAERRNPKILNGRAAPAARGSGTSVGEVNNLVIRSRKARR